jgi:hypothetical protein
MEPWEQFEQFYVIRPVGFGGSGPFWQAFHITTNEPASPRYNVKEAAIHYVQQELKREMEEQVEKLLGASNEHIRS